MKPFLESGSEYGRCQHIIVIASHAINGIIADDYKWADTCNILSPKYLLREILTYYL